jgi:hypothetical protein
VPCLNFEGVVSFLGCCGAGVFACRGDMRGWFGKEAGGLKVSRVVWAGHQHVERHRTSQVLGLESLRAARAGRKLLEISW